MVANSRTPLTFGAGRRGQARVGHGVAIAAGDASGDGRADIYVARGSWGRNRPDLLLVNDGTGRAFTSVSIPQAESGRADDVMALDHDRDGLTDFLVLDGRRGPGPVRLLAAFEAE